MPRSPRKQKSNGQPYQRQGSPYKRENRNAVVPRIARNHDGSLSGFAQSASIASPWKEKPRIYSHGIIGLHEEIEDFYSYIAPTFNETKMRQHVVDEITQAIHTIYPYAKVEVFGSFSTGLVLPSSDIDLIVFGKWNPLPFCTLRDCFLRAQICTYDGVKILDKATVPIIKVTHYISGLKVDISFNMVNGLNTAIFINDHLARYPCLPKLCLTLKQFLYHRDLNEVFTGGISSYALILMLISFLQVRARSLVIQDTQPNLGVLLLEFFELYGHHFKYHEITIRPYGKGSYIQKSYLRSLGSNPGMLSIEDPIQPGHDICKNMYGFESVRESFKFAFSELKNAVMDYGQTNYGILHRILRVSGDDIDYRNWVEKEFREH